MPCRGLHAIPAGPPEFPELATVYVICGEKLNVMIDAGVTNSIHLVILNFISLY